MLLSDLARGIGKRPGNLYRILAFLRHRGYIERVGRSGGYVLTSRVVALAHAVRPADRLSAVGRDSLVRAAEGLGRTCCFVALEGSRSAVIERALPRTSQVALAMRVGANTPALRSDVGRLLLAGCVDVWLQRRMRAWPEHQDLSQRERHALVQELRRLRNEGFVWNGRGWMPGLIEAAVRIGSERQGVMVALAVMWFDGDPGPEAEQALDILQREARVVAEAMGLT